MFWIWERPRNRGQPAFAGVGIASDGAVVECVDPRAVECERVACRLYASANLRFSHEGATTSDRCSTSDVGTSCVFDGDPDQDAFDREVSDLDEADRDAFDREVSDLDEADRDAFDRGERGRAVPDCEGSCWSAWGRGSVVWGANAMAVQWGAWIVKDHPFPNDVLLLTAGESLVEPAELPELLSVVQADLAIELEAYRVDHECVYEDETVVGFLVDDAHWATLGDQLELERDAVDAARSAHDRYLRSLLASDEAAPDPEEALYAKDGVVIEKPAY